MSKKTVKELCTTDISKDEMGNFPESMYELSLIFDKRLKEILQSHEKELAEKDKEHKEQLKRMYEQFKHDKELEIGQYKFENEQRILFKEDFDIQYYCSYHGNWDQCIVEDEEEPTKEKLSKYIPILKDNSKYDKLPSKDVK